MTEVDRVLANIASYGLRLLGQAQFNAAYLTGWLLIAHQHERATRAGFALIDAVSRSLPVPR